MEPQAAMLLPSFILLHSSIVMQQPHHACKLMCQSHSSQCSALILQLNTDYTCRLSRRPSKILTALASSDHIPANNGNTVREAFPQHHLTSLQHSFATNGAPAPVNHTHGKHQTVASAEAIHHIEDNSSGVYSSSKRALKRLPPPTSHNSQGSPPFFPPEHR